MGNEVESKKRVTIVSLQMVKGTLYTDRKCNSPQALYQLFSPVIENKDREHLILAGLNQKLEPTIIQTIHIGTINQSLAYPRDILKSALLSNSVLICIAHNHPSGDETASLADILLTARLEKSSETTTD
ncbi:DNA repair protein RadC [Enterococcus hulanensis]|uniref:JAB domain-containing protein n=1 Tax=Enterococcus hulanensis TaxID=2559929 RepID=UPI001A90EA94|nr:JAB domain-containing protein [Enterococcus hulanensis]MBO0412367.1 DNA repair protein RadC [Enterococcus hulanensis]